MMEKVRKKGAPLPEDLGKRAVSTVVEEPAATRRTVAVPLKNRKKSLDPTRRKVSYGSQAPFRRVADRFPFTDVKSVGPRRASRLQKKLNEEAVARLRDTAILLTESDGGLVPEGLEKTYSVSQRDIIGSVEYGVQKKMFQFDLSFGPYNLDVSRNGRFVLAAGRKGCMSLLDLHDMSSLCEVNVQQTIRDVQFLHNHTLWAAAQKKYLHIYDQQGVEVHCLRDHMLPYCLDFLPYHFLLVSIGEFGELSYLDISTGQVAAKHLTKRGPCYCLRQNAENGVIHLGHSKGTVSLWTPNFGKPVVEMLCHKGGVTAMGLYGNYLATAGADGYWKVWDNRKYQTLNEFRYFGEAPVTLDWSQNGVLALGMGPHVQVWKDVFRTTKPRMPYLSHFYPSQVVESIRFRPFEDICLSGTSHGFGTLMVPGAGKANFDSRECNPFETKKQRRENEVRSLLEKLQPDMISLSEKQIGCIDEAPRAVIEEETEKEAEERRSGRVKRKNKTRGRQAILKRKQVKVSKRLEVLKSKTTLRLARQNAAPDSRRNRTTPFALDRFRFKG